MRLRLALLCLFTLCGGQGLAMMRPDPQRLGSTCFDENPSPVVVAYFGYRYYSPRLGRWISRDPLGEAGGLNLYAYCGNDPVNSYDYLGMDPKRATNGQLEEVLRVVDSVPQVAYWDYANWWGPAFGGKINSWWQPANATEKARLFRCDGEGWRVISQREAHNQIWSDFKNTPEHWDVVDDIGKAGVAVAALPLVLQAAASNAVLSLSVRASTSKVVGYGATALSGYHMFNMATDREYAATTLGMGPIEAGLGSMEMATVDLYQAGRGGFNTARSFIQNQPWRLEWDFRPAFSLNTFGANLPKVKVVARDGVVHGHHTYVKALGGHPDQPLADLVDSLHIGKGGLHSELSTFEGGWLRPRKGLKGAQIVTEFGREAVEEGLRRFYLQDRWRHLLPTYERAVQFTRNAETP